MPIIHVQISYNSVTLKDWEGLPVEKETKIKDFFNDISISCLSSNFWKQILNRTPIINAFDILNANSSNLFVPEFGNSPRNALEKLRLDLSNWIKNNGGGWKGRDAAQSIRKKFVTDLTSALWYIDSRSVETLNQKFKIPVIFDEFFGRSQPESYKSARPKFNSDELIQQNKKILNYVELSWMLQNRFNWLKESLYKFGEILAKYSEYLDHQQIRSKEIKNSLTPIVNEIEVGSIEIFSANIWQFWKPLNVNEFCPEERMKRHRFIEGLDSAFLFKVGVYKYHHGTAQNVIYIWQINLEANETEIINKNYEV
ncbi:unnamed protein product [Rhizophagus irregularis]|nr:unnamed protein product [Rhizophagus irregularis]